MARDRRTDERDTGGVRLQHGQESGTANRNGTRDVHEPPGANQDAREAPGPRGPSSSRSWCDLGAGWRGARHDSARREREVRSHRGSEGTGRKTQGCKGSGLAGRLGPPGVTTPVVRFGEPQLNNTPTVVIRRCAHGGNAEPVTAPGTSHRPLRFTLGGVSQESAFPTGFIAGVLLVAESNLPTP